jgi:hypothetical protein
MRREIKRDDGIPAFAGMTLLVRLSYLPFLLNITGRVIVSI